jgi:hypothetical protein
VRTQKGGREGLRWTLHLKGALNVTLTGARLAVIVEIPVKEMKEKTRRCRVSDGRLNVKKTETERDVRSISTGMATSSNGAATVPLVILPIQLIPSGNLWLTVHHPPAGRCQNTRQNKSPLSLAPPVHPGLPSLTTPPPPCLPPSTPTLVPASPPPSQPTPVSGITLQTLPFPPRRLPPCPPLQTP